MKTLLRGEMLQKHTGEHLDLFAAELGRLVTELTNRLLPGPEGSALQVGVLSYNILDFSDDLDLSLKDKL